jgi:nitroreductase
VEALDALLTRQSVSAKDLGLPMPTAEQRERAFAAALTAPDHGAIRPWRFLTVEGEGLRRLGEVFADSARRAGADEKGVEGARDKALRSPLLIVCAAKVNPGHPKVPVVEQVIAAGCATQNLLTAFHAMGFGAVLVTGGRAYDAGVKQALGLAPEDAIVGFLHVGTPRQPPRPRTRPPVAHHVRAWP